MAANELRTSVCTDLDSLAQDVSLNAQITNENITNLTNQIQNITLDGTSDHKVSLNAADEAAIGYDYLHAKINDNATFDIDQDMVVASETVANSTERFFVDVSAIVGYGPNTFLTATDSNTVEWAPLPSAVDDDKVLVTGTDSTPSFLHDAFNLNAAYVSGADILVATETVGSGGTNQKERPFLDVSAISGYAGSGTFFLGLVNNVSTYINAADIVSAGVTAGYALDTSSNTVSFDPTEITGFAAAFQIFTHLSTDTAATEPAWKSVTGYDDTKNQVWWHQSGAFAFKTATNYDTGTAQYLGHINGSWQFLGIPKFAITTEAIPAATGNYSSGDYQPGKTAGTSNILLYEYGATYGAPATRGTLAKCENYMRAAVAIHKPIFVFERATGIYVVPAEGCAAVPAS